MAKQLLRKFNFSFVVLLFEFILSLAASFYLFACEDDWCYYFDWQKKANQVIPSGVEGSSTASFPVLQSKKNTFNPEKLTIDSIFDPSHDWVATLSAGRVRVLIATGDVLPARAVNYNNFLKNNILWPYEKVTPVIENMNPDITFINLETPLIKNCPLTQIGMVFCGDVKNVEGLTYLSVNVANLANNHMGNQGIDGVKQTINILEDNGILAVGVKNNPVIKEVRGLNLAFLGYSDVGCGNEGISCAKEEIIQKEVAKAKQESDIVVVAFHWGEEYTSQPSKRQIALSHLTIDSGADLIIGNHPHWIQAAEIYKGKVISYAHGNFVFDQMWSLKTRQGVVGKYIFYDKDLVDVEFMPILIEDYGQPHFLEKEERQIILEQMRQESVKLAKNGVP